MAWPENPKIRWQMALRFLSLSLATELARGWGASPTLSGRLPGSGVRMRKSTWPKISAASKSFFSKISPASLASRSAAKITKGLQQPPSAVPSLRYFHISAMNMVSSGSRSVKKTGKTPPQLSESAKAFRARPSLVSTWKTSLPLRTWLRSLFAWPTSASLLSKSKLRPSASAVLPPTASTAFFWHASTVFSSWSSLEGEPCCLFSSSRASPAEDPPRRPRTR
mmetsp:Transcript_10382/g.29312  ORF Transcript_10382/g.29312 Transcript_10382/m.29312 type:complete len:223 (-) Transcript_10382:998-1666(-)